MKKNPVLRASTYLEYLKSNPELTYKHIAEEYNISTARVCQTIALVKKLPNEIIDYLSTLSDPEQISYFTERKLRPLTKLESDTDKIAKFMEMRDKLL